MKMQKIVLLKTSLSVVLLLICSACTIEAPPVPVDYPETGSAVTQLYLARCGDCHVAPQPASRTARVWPGIVQRMQMRMRAGARTPLDENELRLILDYVQRHAGTGSKK
jgi:hypothetical protein